jgi:hypothetical protein
MDTDLESMQRLRVVFARSPPGTHAEGSLQTPNCRFDVIRKVCETKEFQDKP